MKEKAVRKGSSAKAILLALLINVVGLSTVSVGSIFLYSIYLSPLGVNDYVNETFNSIQLSSPFFLTCFVLALIISSYAVYFCAKTSVERAYRDVSILSIVCVFLGFILTGHVIIVILHVLAVFLGVRSWKRRLLEESIFVQ